MDRTTGNTPTPPASLPPARARRSDGLSPSSSQSLSSSSVQKALATVARAPMPCRRSGAKNTGSQLPVPWKAKRMWPLARSKMKGSPPCSAITSQSGPQPGGVAGPGVAGLQVGELVQRRDAHRIAAHAQGDADRADCLVIRLAPGADLRIELCQFCWQRRSAPVARRLRTEGAERFQQRRKGCVVVHVQCHGMSPYPGRLQSGKPSSQAYAG